jgi:DNA helicase-2/ATP-dependent DNA helicase PcrA
VIDLRTFHAAYQRAFSRSPNTDQRKAIEASSNGGVFIVAGPGTGKTACLTLRILKLVLVDDLPPRGILATTFTIKAAAELRSRVLGWGFRLVEELLRDRSLPTPTKERLRRVDINQVLTGTIDSVCDQLLRDHREPGGQPPVLADDFISKTLLLRG